MADDITISYTGQQGQGAASVVIKNFLGNTRPRGYQDNNSVDFAVTGSVFILGPSYRNKYLWTINTLLNNTAAATLETLFENWDSDRGAGYTAAVSVVDATTTSTKNSSAIFSTAPAFDRNGPNYWSVAFGLTEV